MLHCFGQWPQRTCAPAGVTWKVPTVHPARFLPEEGLLMNSDSVYAPAASGNGCHRMRGAMLLLAFALSASACGSPSTSADLVAADAYVADDSAFARMLAGFHQCRYEGLYVSDLPGHAATVPDTDWFRAHPEAACGRDDDFYYFCMNERYHGLDVHRMALPGTGGLPSVALYLKQDPATARSMLEHQLGSDFSSSPASDAGTAPELMEDPVDAGRSILVCTREF